MKTTTADSLRTLTSTRATWNLRETRVNIRGVAEFNFFVESVLDSSKTNRWKGVKTDRLGAIDRASNYFEAALKDRFGPYVRKLTPKDATRLAKSTGEMSSIPRVLHHLEMRTSKGKVQRMRVSTCIKTMGKELIVEIPKTDIDIYARKGACDLVGFVMNDSMLVIDAASLGEAYGLIRQGVKSKSNAGRNHESLIKLIDYATDHWNMKFPVKALFEEGLVRDYIRLDDRAQKILTPSKSWTRLTNKCSTQFQQFKLMRRKSGSAKVIMVSVDKEDGKRLSTHFRDKKSAYTSYKAIVTREDSFKQVESYRGFCHNVVENTKRAIEKTMSQRPKIYEHDGQRVFFVSISEKLSPLVIDEYAESLRAKLTSSWKLVSPIKEDHILYIGPNHTDRFRQGNEFAGSGQ